MGSCMVFKNHRRGWCQWNKPKAYELHLNRAHEMFEPAKISSGITVFGLFSELFLLPKLPDCSVRFFRYGIFRVALLFICQGTILISWWACLSTFQVVFVVALFSAATLISYHTASGLSTTFLKLFSHPLDIVSAVDFHYNTFHSSLSTVFLCFSIGRI